MAVEDVVRAPLTLGGYPVRLPRLDDPRLRLSAVVVSLQVLGQVELGFKVSIAQILVTIGVCAAIEIAVTARREHLLAWPASALLTGNSIAFILRANGTRHGDWWSLNGIEYFVFAAGLAMLSKYLIRPGGRHLYNPSNLALVLTLLWYGPGNVFPQYLWWGDLSTPVVLAVAVIVAGAIWILRPLGLLPMAAAFTITFWALIGVGSVLGACFVAIWSPNPVCGADYWYAVALSPELLIFCFFMMSDPQTAPRTPDGRIGFGLVVALAAALLVLLEPFEFGIKVALLGSLTCVLAGANWIDSQFGERRPWGRSPATNLALAVVIVVTALVPLLLLSYSRDQDAINRDLVKIAATLPNPQ